MKDTKNYIQIDGLWYNKNDIKNEITAEEDCPDVVQARVGNYICNTEWNDWYVVIQRSDTQVQLFDLESGNLYKHVLRVPPGRPSDFLYNVSDLFGDPDFEDDVEVYEDLAACMKAYNKTH